MIARTPTAQLDFPVGPVFLTLVGAGLTVAFLGGTQLPLITSDRRAVAALVVLGWLACSMAVGPVTRALGWGDPLVLAAMGLGLLALTLIVLVALDRAAVLAAVPEALGVRGLSGNRIAFVSLALVLLAKVCLGVATYARRG